MRILLLILIAAAIAGCARNPKVALEVRQSSTNLNFEISAKHINGLTEFQIWQADTKELFWDIALRYYREPRLTYGDVPTNFKTIWGESSSAEQKFPVSGQTPHAFPPRTKFLAAIYYQYDTMFDANVGEVYFVFTTDADGRVLSVLPTRVAHEDLPKRLL